MKKYIRQGKVGHITPERVGKTGKKYQLMTIKDQKYIVSENKVYELNVEKPQIKFKKCIEEGCKRECMCDSCGGCQEHHNAQPDVRW